MYELFEAYHELSVQLMRNGMNSEIQFDLNISDFNKILKFMIENSATAGERRPKTLKIKEIQQAFPGGYITFKQKEEK